MDEAQFLLSVQAGNVENAVKEYIAAHPNISIAELTHSVTKSEYVEAAEKIARYYCEIEPQNPTPYIFLGTSLGQQERWEEAIEAYEQVIDMVPTAKVAYAHICGIYMNHINNLGKLRDIIQRAQQNLLPDMYLNCHKGLSIESILSPDDYVLYEAHVQSRWAKLAARRQLDQGTSKPKQAEKNRELGDELLTEGGVGLSTESWSEIGSTGMTVAGSVAAALPTAEYRFEYGKTTENLDQLTSWQPMPGAVNAETVMSPQSSGICSRLDAVEVLWEEKTALCTLISPFGFDPNHISGIGFLSLLFSIRPMSCQFDGRREYSSFETSDFRGAEYTIRYRTKDFDPEDFLFSIGLSSGGSPWMMTSLPVDIGCIDQEGVASATYLMNSNPNDWTYMGSNPDDRGDDDPYSYGALDKVLSHGTDMVFFAGISGNWLKDPKGEIGFEEAKIRYRSPCVLNPTNGAELVEQPVDLDCDPARLVDGKRGGSDDGWYQLGPVTQPIKFRWKLPTALELATMVFHQDAAMPTRRVRVTLSDESHDSASVGHSTIYELPAKLDVLMHKLPFILRIEGERKYDSITIEILNAWTREGVGIEAIELFARNYTPPPSREPVTVSEDISDLEPGGRYFYRVACRAGDDIHYGETKVLDLRESTEPFIHSASLYDAAPEKSIIAVRANAMGHRTTLKWRTDDGEWHDVPMGWEITPVHRYITVRDQQALENDCQMNIKLVSDQGESQETIVRWAVPTS